MQREQPRTEVAPTSKSASAGTTTPACGHPSFKSRETCWFSVCASTLFLLLAAAVSLPAQAPLFHISTTLDSGGDVSSNTVTLGGIPYRHVGARAQPGGVTSGTGGGLSHQAGFLPAAEVKRPDLDHNANGVPDELERDNDGDGLADLAELDASAFQGYAATDHNSADTDGDAMLDGSESTAMFDPLDPEHRLALVSVDTAGDKLTLHWIGRGGGTVNAVVYSDDLVSEPITNIVVSDAFPGGTAPWYKVTNQYTYSESGPTRFMAVRIRP